MRTWELHQAHLLLLARLGLGTHLGLLRKAEQVAAAGLLGAEEAAGAKRSRGRPEESASGRRPKRGRGGRSKRL